jgi:hypothetical protein
MTNRPKPRADLAIERDDSGTWEAYNEAAFRHFLAMESKRSERAGRSVLLVLVSLDGEAARGAGRDLSRFGSRIFSALQACVREIDFIGWYRAGRVAGAVLTQGAQTPEPDVCGRIRDRVREFLVAQLPSHMSGQLGVRVVQVRSN